nr:type IV pilin N-terminal domain-containing protein [Candidatus Baldrarchaeota archaeon]
MTTKYMLKRRKAVSTVVAAVLLIAITVVAVAIVWTMVLPMLTPKTKIDITDVVFEDTDDNGYADKVTFTIQNTGTESLRINTDEGLYAYDLSGRPRTGLDFTQGNRPSSWLSSAVSIYAISKTDPEPSSTSYYSLDAGTSVRITVIIRSQYDNGSNTGTRWSDNASVKIKVYLSDGTEFVKSVTVDI